MAAVRARSRQTTRAVARYDLWRMSSHGGIPSAKIWWVILSYANHAAIMKNRRSRRCLYPYFDPSNKMVTWNGPCWRTLSTWVKTTSFLLHWLLPNPTGADLSYRAWAIESRKMANTQGLPAFIDSGLPGFGDGMEEGRPGFRYLAERVPAYLVASSCSKLWFVIVKDRDWLWLRPYIATERMH